MTRKVICVSCVIWRNQAGVDKWGLQILSRQKCGRRRVTPVSPYRAPIMDPSNVEIDLRQLHTRLVSCSRWLLIHQTLIDFRENSASNWNKIKYQTPANNRCRITNLRQLYLIPASPFFSACTPDEMKAVDGRRPPRSCSCCGRQGFGEARGKFSDCQREITSFLRVKGI